MINRLRLSPYLVINSYLKDGPAPYIENSLTSERVLRLEKEDWALLEFCCSLQDYTDVLGRFGKERVTKALARQWLMEEDQMFSFHHITCFELEINTHCNNSCLYCPVCQKRPEGKVMSMELYLEAIKKICEYGSAYFITFNFYNEPFLDPYFIHRLKALSTTGLKVLINTNGTCINAEQMETLKQFRHCIRMIQINIPSYEKTEYNRMTGSSHYECVKENINRLLAEDLPVAFSVNGSVWEYAKNAPLLSDTFSGKLVHAIYHNFTTDRAGTLQNQYAQHIRIGSSLVGCKNPIQTMVIGWNGDIILCCNDYFKTHVYGNLRDGSISEILRSERAIALRKQIFGEIQTGSEFLCRKCWHMKLAKKQRADFLRYMKQTVGAEA